MITTTITGLAELNRTLRALPQALQTRCMKGMVATGASIIRKEAVLRAPMYTGTVQAGHPPPGALKAAIYQTRRVGDCTATHEVWMVNVRKGKKFQQHSKGGKVSNVDAFYASWVEYGHYTRGKSARNASARAAVASGANVPHGTLYVLAHPYMRPAFESKKQEAVRAMGSYLAFRLPDAVAAAKGAR